MKEKGYDVFKVGKYLPPGKPKWENFLRLEMDQNRALDLIEQISARVRMNLINPSDYPIELTLPGELSFEPDE